MAKHYYFNGIELPPLSGVSASDYPYAVIFWNTERECYVAGLHAMELGVHDFNDGNGQVIYTGREGINTFVHYAADLDNWRWAEVEFNIDQGSDGIVLFMHYDPELFRWRWSNHNLCDMDGKVVYEGSSVVIVNDSETEPEAPEPEPEPEEPEPEPEEPEAEIVKWPGLQSWLTGFLLGLAGKPLPLTGRKQREPVAYLYNGVRLPELPAYDRTAYPYACICGGVYLCLSATPFAVDEKSKVTAIAHYLYSDADGFVYHKGWNEYGANLQGTPVWANSDVLNKDDTVFLAGSEPVPVYEEVG